MRPHNDHQVSLDLSDFQQLPALYLSQKLSLNTLTNHKFWNTNTFSLTLSSINILLVSNTSTSPAYFCKKVSLMTSFPTHTTRQENVLLMYKNNIVSHLLNFWFLQMSKKYQLRLQRLNLLSGFPPPLTQGVSSMPGYSVPSGSPECPPAARDARRILQQHCCCMASGQAFTNWAYY